MNIILIILCITIILFLLWRVYFLRNPKRIIPDGNVIVAPADGTVLYIKEVKKGKIPFAVKNKKEIPLNEINGIATELTEDAWLVGIFMSPMSVHRNRIPMQGEIILKEYMPSTSNLSMVKATTDILLRRVPLRDYEFYPVNERQTIGIKTKIGNIFIVQIADKWIKKIVCKVAIGDFVKTGQQYGMIRFGSQCDILLQKNDKLKIVVKPGQYLKAGSSIIAEYID